jgi:hypothetical protein
MYSCKHENCTFLRHWVWLRTYNRLGARFMYPWRCCSHNWHSWVAAMLFLGQPDASRCIILNWFSVFVMVGACTLWQEDNNEDDYIYPHRLFPIDYIQTNCITSIQCTVACHRDHSFTWVICHVAVCVGVSQPIFMDLGCLHVFLGACHTSQRLPHI